jgi:hypothetical protein
MNRLVQAAVAVFCGCGGAPEMGIGVTIEDLNASQIGAVQITVLNNGTMRNCGELSMTCLSSEVTASDIVMVTLSDGQQHLTDLIPACGNQVADAGQAFTLQIPVGQNYLIVAEVLSTSETQLLASGCDLRTQITTGINPAEAITAHAIVPIPACNPLFQ